MCRLFSPMFLASLFVLVGCNVGITIHAPANQRNANPQSHACQTDDECPLSNPLCRDGLCTEKNATSPSPGPSPGKASPGTSSPGQPPSSPTDPTPTEPAPPPTDPAPPTNPTDPPTEPTDPPTEPTDPPTNPQPDPGPQCAQKNELECYRARPSCVLEQVGPKDKRTYICRDPRNACEKLSHDACQKDAKCAWDPGFCYCPPNMMCYCGGGPPSQCRRTQDLCDGEEDCARFCIERFRCCMNAPGAVCIDSLLVCDKKTHPDAPAVCTGS